MSDPVKAEGETTRSTADNNQAGGRAPSPPRRRSRARWVLPALAVVAAVVGYGIWRYLSARETTDDAQIDGHINPVAARVGGTVLAVNCDDNQYVEAGALMVKIDPRDYQVALERARAELAAAEASAKAAGAAVPVTSITTSSQVTSAEAMLQSAEARVTVANREVETAQARLGPLRARQREAEAIYTKALQDLDRMKQLIAKDRISQQQFDAAVAASDSARAALDAAGAAVVEAEKGVDAARARLTQAQAGIAEAKASLQATSAGPGQVSMIRSQAASAEARVLQARAALDRAQLDLDYTDVKAPVSGVVGMKNVEIGQVVQKDQPLLAVVPLEDIWVTANYKESQLANIRPGQPVEIKVDTYAGRTYRGHVDSISPATGARFSLLPPENATGNYVKVVQRIPVKILFERGQDLEHLLRPGMSVVPTVFTKSDTAARTDPK